MRTTRNNGVWELHPPRPCHAPARGWVGVLAGLLLLLAPSVRAQVHAIQAGDIVAANYRAGGGTVVRINPQTGAMRRMGLFNVPTDLALSPDGFLYVSELGGLIMRINLTNGVETVVNPNTTLAQIWGLALGPDGNLYVTTSVGNRIVKVNPLTGEEADLVSAGQLSSPRGIDFLDPTHVVVASRANNRVVSVSLLDQSQAVLAQGADGIDLPWGIAVFDGHIYVGALDSRLLLRISGGTVTNILPVVSPKLAGGPYGIGTDPDGNIVIGISGGLSGPYALERRDAQGYPLPAFSGKYIGEVTGVEVSRINVVAASQVNTPPLLPEIGEWETDEGVAMAFTIEGSDSDWPLQELTYSLVGTAPAGALLSPSGVFTWKPTEAQGPSTNTFVMVVTDDGIPPLSTTQSFTIVVKEVNSPPYITPVGNKVTSVGSLLSFKVNATDPDWPAQTLTFSLAPDPPLGASITTGGDFSWTPGADLGPGDYTIGVIVTDDQEPPLTDTHYFTVSVREANVPPVFGVLTNRVADEGVLQSYQITATDANVPAQSLTFAFASNAPAGAALSATGLFTWTPTEAQGPGSYLIVVRVTDNGIPPLSTTNSFTLTVREVNRAPVLDLIADQVVHQGGGLAFKVTAKDLDLPPQELTFSLASGAPTNATITAAGDFSWAADAAQAAGFHVITVVVTDSGDPPLTHTRSFTVEARGTITVNVGDILVADNGANAVVKIDGQTGVGLRLGTFPSPTDVAFAASGFIYVTEQGGAIERLELRTGNISLVNTTPGLYDLRGIELGPDGQLYVTTGWDDAIVRVDPATGDETLVTQGGLLSGPFGLAFLDSNHLIVSSYYADRIVSVALTNNTQHLVAEGNGLNQPWGVASSGGRISLVSAGAHAVQTISNGVAVPLATTTGAPSGIGIAPDGHLAVSVNGAAPELDWFSPAGALLTNLQSGLVGFCMGVEVVASPVGSLAPTLQWSETPDGSYLDEPTAAVEPAHKRITTPLRGSACFYRLRSAAPTRIAGWQISGAQVVLTYE